MRYRADEPTDQDLPILPADTPGRIYPSIPGNLDAVPDWLDGDAPFDPVTCFIELARGENAAPLYLDALYEFCPNEMEVCVAPAERRARGRALKERYARTDFLQKQDQATVRPDERAEAAAEYIESFDKLLLAQRRSACVFALPLGIEAARAPHAPPARFVATLVDWSAEAFLADGEIEPVLDDLEMLLRLGRDLRPQGSAASQLVSAVVDAIVVRRPLQRALGAHGLTARDCDRLLEMLERHSGNGADHLSECLPIEYFITRATLEALRRKEDVAAQYGWPGLSYGQVAGNTARLLGDQSDVAGRVDTALATMTDADFSAEVQALNRLYACFFERAQARKPWALDAVLLELQQELLGTKLLKLLPDDFRLVVEAIRRNGIWIGGAKCQVALCRWKLEHGRKLPPDLATLCESAGMDRVPLDTYRGEPLRSTKIDGEFVIYSRGASEPADANHPI